MVGLLEHYEHSISSGPWHEPEGALPASPPPAHPVRFIAYYLPQFHMDPVNDAAWGRGFTEWTNVSKTLPRVAGQVQPRLPADLGFYDLSHAGTLRAQAELARRAGIWGFCIHDYWFSGTKVLSKPLQVLLENPDIDLRFCLNWANENWSRRWDGSEDEIILAQKHAPDDAEAYLNSIATALRDPRYIRVEDRPLLMVYRPGILPDAADTVARWRAEARRLGIGELFIVHNQSFNATDPRPGGFDALAGFPPHGPGVMEALDRRRERLLDPEFKGRVCRYETMAEASLNFAPTEFTHMPAVCPSWDNSARRGRQATMFLGADPAKYGWWLRAAARRALRTSRAEARVVFLNAWNEWAEGAVLEPDRHYGYAWLAETRRALDDLVDNPEAGEGAPMPDDDRTPEHFLSRRQGWLKRLNYAVNRAYALRRKIGRHLGS